MNRSSTTEEPGGASGVRRRTPVAAAIARAWPLALFAVAFAATALVFRPVWPLNLVLGGPDGMPDLSLPGFSRRVLLWAARGEATLCHDGALKMLLPSLVWHEWGLCATFALQALCMAVFLRTMRAPRMACCCGGVAFAFAGYNFTLFAAGHRGVFAMTPYAVLLFALVESENPVVICGDFSRNATEEAKEFLSKENWYTELLEELAEWPDFFRACRRRFQKGGVHADDE